MICAKVHADTNEEAADEALGDALACLENVLLEDVEREDGNEDYELILAYLGNIVREGGYATASTTSATSARMAVPGRG